MSTTSTAARQPAAIPLFGAEPWDPAQRYDIVFLGVPVDLGTYGRGRTPAGAPAALRGAARVFPGLRGDDDRTIGWYDYTRARPLLAGRRLADAGDLIIDRHHPLDSMVRLPEEVERLRASADLVVVLGGDHSVTYWTVKGMEQGSALLFLDAHEDATPMLGEWPHCGNVVSFLEQDPGLSAIVQYGLRGLVPNQRRRPAQMRRIVDTREAWRASVRDLHDRPMALSIDVDVLDPILLSSVVSPSPGGMSTDALLAAVADARAAGGHIGLLEFMEFAPAPGDQPVDAVTLAQLLLRLLDLCVGEE